MSGYQNPIRKRNRERLRQKLIIMMAAIGRQKLKIIDRSGYK